MNYINWSEQIPVIRHYDVIVAGGGVAGAAAALAAARQGMAVLLLEKQCSLGGLATTGLVNFWVPLCNGRGKQIIRGMSEEFLKLSVAHGFDTFPSHWKEGKPKEPTTQRCESSFSSGMFSLELLDLLRTAGVTILYDALISAPVMEGNYCIGVILDGKSGRQFYGCRVLVDATGDAAIMKQVGMPVADGSNYFTYYGEGITLEGCRQAAQTGEIHRAYYHAFGGTVDLHGNGQKPEFPLYTGVSLETINRYLQDNQRKLLEKECKRPRGQRNVHMLPGMPQLRTSRCLIGDAVFTADTCYQHCETSIGTICDFEYRDKLYEVPYGTLVRTGYDNLITCGRSASASGWGWDVLRVIPPAILTGQAAGIAAALSIRCGCSLPEIPIATLQETLADTGVIIHFPDSWIPQKEEGDIFAAPESHI